jgi:23S rRNA (adenine2503-C2)-methyltransferase
MRVFAKAGREDIALVYLAEFEKGKQVEFVESLQPPLPREKKWVLIVSTLFGCPVKCPICDAGSFYLGKLSKEEIFSQIDFLVNKRFPEKKIAVEKFKIQFARMGEPAFNSNVLEVLEELPQRYNAPHLIPCISTIAPSGMDEFFEKLLEIKKKNYQNGKFQMQFSLHTTDEELRDKLIPIKKWDFSKIAEYGKDFYENEDRKIALNFALAKEMPVDPELLLKHFDPEIFLLKITPLNPTYQALKNGLFSYIEPEKDEDDYEIIKKLRSSGYEVIISIGELEENFIGSNCGQYLMKHLEAKGEIKDAYSYELKEY